VTVTTRHAVERTFERVGAAIGTELAERLAAAVESYAATCRPFESVAVLVTRTPFIGTAWSDQSNGDCLVAIVRGRSVVTLMFRRRSQPFNRQALSVDRVATLDNPRDSQPVAGAR